MVTGPAARLGGLVYIDALHPDDGNSALSLMPPPVQESFRSRAAAEGCRLVELPTGHDVMLEAPAEVVRVIHEAATTGKADVG